MPSRPWRCLLVSGMWLASVGCFGSESSAPSEPPPDPPPEVGSTTEENPCAPLDPLCAQRNGEGHLLGATVRSVSGVASSSCVAMGERIYCLGGTAGGARFNRIWSYDYAANTFQTDVNATLPTGREGAACVAAADGSIYCFGGYTGEGSGDPYLSEIVRYDPGKDRVSLMNETLPSRRSGMACAATDTNIYCFGGTDGRQNFDTILQYDFRRDLLIYKKAVLPEARNGMACVSSSGFIFCFGGSGPGPLSGGLIYDYGADGVIPLDGILPQIATDLSCVEAGEGAITCIGGSDGIRDIEHVTRFDAATLRARKIESDSLPSLPFGRSRISCAAVKDKIYCFGGISSNSVLGAELTDILVYDTTSGSADIQRDIDFNAEAVGLSFLSCAATGEDRAYCFGGLGGSLGSGTQTRRILSFNYGAAKMNGADDHIEVVQNANLPTYRALHSCVTAENGMIYCLGGLRGSPTSGADLTDIIEFKPSDGSAGPVGASLPRGRWGMGCALAGGKIYCLGGVSGNVIDPSRSIVYDEILEFDPALSAIPPKKMAAKLPFGRALHSCAPALTSIYCFGGAARDAGGLPVGLADVIEYDYTRDFLQVKEATLSQPLLGLSCAPAGGKIYCFGGAGGVFDRPTDQIFEYDPERDSLTVLGITMPGGRLAHSCTNTNSNILCFGGFPESLFYDGSAALANSLSQVYEYCPPPCGATPVTTTAAE